MTPLTEPRRQPLRRALGGIVGKAAVLTDPQELMVYESDGLTLFRALADFVVFPTSTEQVSALVALATTGGVAFVAPGKSPRPPGIPAHGRPRRLGGDLRHRDEDRGAPAQATAGGEDGAGGLRRDRWGLGGGCGDHRPGPRPRGPRDDRPGDDPGRRGRLRLRVPARCRRGAPHRAGRAGGRGGGAGRGGGGGGARGGGGGGG